MVVAETPAASEASYLRGQSCTYQDARSVHVFTLPAWTLPLLVKVVHVKNARDSADIRILKEV
eukprot:6188812-Pleurochrysis_carterae.AAC.1